MADFLQTLFIGLTFLSTILIHKEVSKNDKKAFFNQQLFELQKMSFYDPFVEDEHFTNMWDELKQQYCEKKLEGEELNKFLKYDVYTEMLFNYIRISLDFYKDKDKLLEYVDFATWVNTHKKCWKNPLIPHSNRKVYGKDMCDMIDDWLR